MSTWSPYAAAVLIMLGALFSLLGALGVWRLPDAYTRMHSASKAGALGAILVLVGVLFATGGLAWVELMVAITLLATTAPLAAHAISRAGHMAGIKPKVGPLGDELDESSGRPTNDPNDRT